MLLAIIKYTSKFQLHAKFPELWAHVGDRLDNVLAVRVTSQITKGVLRKEFLEKNKLACSCFVPLKETFDIDKQIDEDAEIDLTAFLKIIKSATGSALFKKERSVVQFKIYVAMVTAHTF